ncbi:uncharacterized protein LOC114254601 [Monomorium pharaonis]|uniref:uncharacterized protein LOC114254601 n=1 Tax=Monomorium pharaonis TaxID=307658 RepID=UPI001746F51F|nr:uncharacterized protein LOC114254601 [Monomorium pharaonis]XP_036144496.1 uncharacterized protein LOC114254601 [Monomorium pharaonis]
MATRLLQKTLMLSMKLAKMALFCCACHHIVCSHRLQPLDIAFMKPLSKFLEDEIRKFLCTNSGKVVTLGHIASLFGAAYIKAATMSTAVNAFKKSRIFPPDPNVFSDADFMPSLTTDIELPCSATGEVTLANALSAALPSATPAELSLEIDANSEQQSRRSSSVFEVITPEKVCPFYELLVELKERGKTAILTSSPYKNQLFEEIFQKQTKEKNKKEKEKRKNAVPQDASAPKKSRGRPPIQGPSALKKSRGQSPTQGPFAAKRARGRPST